MDLEEISVMTPKKFAIKIETIVAKGGVSYMDAILDYCEKNQMGVRRNCTIHIKTPQRKNRSRCKRIELLVLK